MSTEVMVQDLGRDKLELIKQTVAKGVTDLELDLFLHACKRTGLDPLMKQIYAIKRKNHKNGKEEMSIQTGIDGYRLIADRTGKYAGSHEPEYQIAEDGWPDVASVTVYKMVGDVPRPFSASARWKEYCQDSSPTWKKMPFLMLGKCAEALALRKAFPAELSGVYTHEEMMQADAEPATQAAIVTANKQTAQAKIAELKREAMTAGESQPSRQPDSSTSAPEPTSMLEQQGHNAAAPPPSFMAQASAVSDWKAVIDDTNDLPGLQKHWHTITQDPQLDSTQKVELFKVYQARVKAIPKKK